MAVSISAFIVGQASLICPTKEGKYEMSGRIGYPLVPIFGLLNCLKPYRPYLLTVEYRIFVR
jgi:hypothetical protein